MADGKLCKNCKHQESAHQIKFNILGKGEEEGVTGQEALEILKREEGDEIGRILSNAKMSLLDCPGFE